MMKRSQRAVIAEETLEILKAGFYEVAGQRTSIRDEIKTSCDNTRLYKPNEYETLLQQVAKLPRVENTHISVSQQTTLQAAQHLSRNFSHVGVLNFASAKNPGGGFLSGSQAQEESLARSSGLYASQQTQFKDFYEYHRGLKTCLYSDHMIFSPQVPVFRDDDGHLLAEPYNVSFITSPAPNAGAIVNNEPENISNIEATFLRRSRMVLAVFAVHGCNSIILGAWGCGVFRNEPAAVARIFHQVLSEELFQNRFEHIEFAIYDPHPPHATYELFHNEFIQ